MLTFKPEGTEHILPNSEAWTCQVSGVKLHLNFGNDKILFALSKIQYPVWVPGRKRAF
jgi:hypothetical protein